LHISTEISLRSRRASSPCQLAARTLARRPLASLQTRHHGHPIVGVDLRSPRRRLRFAIMARPRTFDPNDILLKARQVFWLKGYQSTTLDDITAATGLTKPSLYAGFGDKASLFLKVLDDYHDRLVARSAGILSNAPTARAGVEDWLMSLLPICSGKKGRRGCLSVNTLTDGGPKDAAVEKSIANYNARLERLILGRLQADRAQFSPDFDPVAASRTIMAVYTGLMAMAKQSQSEEQVRLVIRQVGRLFS
jgi:TetR/AcrR family transcriptional regulator, transcriptional repressor for nem operon